MLIIDNRDKKKAFVGLSPSATALSPSKEKEEDEVEEEEKEEEEEEEERRRLRGLFDIFRHKLLNLNRRI